MEQMNDFQLPILKPDQILRLGEPVLLSEVKEAVFDLPKNSYPGSDGYHASFYQKNWNLVANDVYNMVSSVWRSGHILKAINKTNVYLIPKTDYPQSFNDLRPISLSNVSYRILSKVLCNPTKRGTCIFDPPLPKCLSQRKTYLR